MLYVLTEHTFIIYVQYIETDLAWSSSLEYVRIMVRHEACPPGGNLVLMCAVVSNSASAVP